MVTFGRYRLVERLGAGGMAVVYRAVADGPRGFARELTIKRLKPELSQHPEFVAALMFEARLSGLLHHPSIVQVHELGRVGDEYYMAMEYVDGVDLATLLGRAHALGRATPPGVAAFIASQVAAALAYAHDLCDGDGRPLEIVHRDVSPSNVMVTARGAVKLLDFGIAKAADHIRDIETRGGGIKGKLGYLSPQQADGQPIDRRADIFALGVVLHEMLTMERLFRGDDQLATLRLVREAKVAPPSARRPGLDPRLDVIVGKMLARAPAARFATCDEVVRALQPIVHELVGDAEALRRFVAELAPLPSKRAPLDGEAAAAETALTASAATPSTQAPAARRRWGAPVLAAGALACGIAVAAAWSHRHRAATATAAVPAGAPLVAATPPARTAAATPPPAATTAGPVAPTPPVAAPAPARHRSHASTRHHAPARKPAVARRSGDPPLADPFAGDRRR